MAAPGVDPTRAVNKNQRQLQGSFIRDMENWVSGGDYGMSKTEEFAMRSSKWITLALVASLAAVLVAKASATPLNGMAAVSQQVTDGLQKVAWVCGPYRCWWRPGPYWRPYAYWGPRRYWWGRPYWHRWS
jgi:hypothetical protein